MSIILPRKQRREQPVSEGFTRFVPAGFTHLADITGNIQQANNRYDKFVRKSKIIVAK